MQNGENFEAYIDTINFYYDPSMADNIERNPITVFLSFAQSMMKAELVWTLDSNYNFNDYRTYFNLGEIVETASVDNENAFFRGSKQVEVKNVVLDERDGKAIKFRIFARVTDENNDEVLDEWRIYHIKLLPNDAFTLDGDANG